MSATRVGEQASVADREAVSWRRWAAVAALFQFAIIGAFVAVMMVGAAERTLFSVCSSVVHLIAAACILRGLTDYRPRHRAVWILLLLQCLWSALFVPLRNLSIADPWWWAIDSAAATAVDVAAAALLVHARAAARDRSLWIDIVVICLGSAFVLFAYLGAPLLTRSGASATTILTAVIVPSLDVVLIALTLLLAFTWRDRSVSLGLLIVAFGLVPLDDVFVQLEQLDRLHLPPRRAWAPFGMIVAALVGVAASHPSARTLEVRATGPLTPWGRTRTALIVAAFLLALGGLLPGRGARLPTALVGTVLAIMFLLIVSRAYLALRSLAESHDRIRQLAMLDRSTGLPNAAGLKEAYERDGAEAGETWALLMLRMGAFHEVGQLWGVAARSAWIRQLARRLEFAAAHEGVFARVGSDRFALLMRLRGREPGVVDFIATHIAEAAYRIEVDAETTIVSAFDIGIAWSTDQTAGDDLIETLLRDAESAMEIAHAQGENRIAHYDAAVSALEQRRFILLTHLRGAIQRNEFVLHYQPIVELSTRTAVFHEALLRWSVPELGAVSPCEFIPLAESIGVIEEITDWVMAAACATVAAANRRDGMRHRVSVNLSSHSLRAPGLAQRVLQIIDQHALAAGSLCLELTERTQAFDAHHELSTLRAHGVAIAIDDFGIGYSNLAMLAHLEVDKVKLDIGFVRVIEADATMHELCRSVFAHIAARGAEVVAEGIETESQHALMRALGCNYGQGWLYGRAQPRLSVLAAYPPSRIG